MSYAVIKNGGKQYKVSSGDIILIEKNIAKKGSEIKFDDVIMLGEKVNIKTDTSELAKVNVIGEVLEQTRGPKLTIFKKKRRHNYRRKKGHKQDLTLVRIKSIEDGKTKSSKKEEKKAKTTIAKKSEKVVTKITTAKSISDKDK
tara:strand:+ start:288 stop:719 length:432 start_codon:yes stop_codon:yes gene_type:complete